MRTAIALFLGLTLAAAPLAAQERIDIRRAAAADGVVEIRNLAGSVTVTGWDRAEVEVTGTLGRGAERVEVTTEGGMTRIRVIVPQRTQRDVATTLNVRVPSRSRLHARTVSAAVTVSDVAGSVEAETTSGAVTVSGRPAAVTARTVSGGIELSAGAAPIRATSVSGGIRVGGAPGDVNAETVSGAIQVESAPAGARAMSVSGTIDVRGVAQRLDAHSHSGRVRVTASGLVDARVNTMSGDLEFTGDVAANGSASFHSHSGSVRLSLPRNFGGEFALNTFSGRVRNELGGEMLVSERNRIRFTTAGGGARISVNTFSGSIEILPR